MSHNGELYRGSSSRRPLMLPVILSHGKSPVLELKVPMKRVVR